MNIYSLYTILYDIIYLPLKYMVHIVKSSQDCNFNGFLNILLCTCILIFLIYWGQMFRKFLFFYISDHCEKWFKKIFWSISLRRILQSEVKTSMEKN